MKNRDTAKINRKKMAIKYGLASTSAYLLAYSYYMSFVFDLALHRSSASLAYFTAFFGFIGVVLYLSLIIKGEKLPRAYYAGVLIAGLVFLGVVLTDLNSGLSDTLYGAVRSCFVRSIPALLVGMYLAQTKALIYFDPFVMPIVAIASLSLFGVVLLNPTGDIWAYANEGIDRQTLSYVASFILCLGMYYLARLAPQDTGKMTSKKMSMCVIVVCMGLDVVSLFAGGGRGAIVVCVVVAIYFLLRTHVIFDFRKLIVFVLFFSIAAGLFSYLPSLGATSMGFDRIASFFSGSMDQSSLERLTLYSSSIALFSSHPLFGNGIGGAISVFGVWPHNLIIEILVDYGLAGLSIFALLAVFCIKKITCAVADDVKNEVILVIGITCVVNLMFSGTYISDGGSWLFLGFCLVYSRLDKTNTSCDDMKHLGDSYEA